MRVVEHEADLEAAYVEASAESEANFSDGRLYAERLITGGRHVEVQIIADNYGSVLHLGERECSIQRRHQKVLEEAPSPALDPAARAALLNRVTEAVRAVGYRGAGTVELLLDQSGDAWFMEMNTRLQVEHPVTEVTTGLDLVELQFRVAAGEPLPLSQDEVITTGHAIECRINAEDPSRGFAPCPGLVEQLNLPSGEGIRVDTHLHAGDIIPPYYDSMVAKIIASAPTREAAIERMRVALAQTSVVGVVTNIELHRQLMDWRSFTSGRYDTTSLERYLTTEERS